MLRSVRYLLTFLSLFLAALTLEGSFARTGNGQSGLDALVQAMSASLVDEGIKKVVVFDLSGPDGQYLHFGSWLADQISKRLALANEKLKVIDRSDLGTQINEQHLTPKEVLEREVRARLAQLLGADGFVTGSFGPFEGNLGITLLASRGVEVKTEGISQFATMINGKVPLDGEMSSNLTEPLESLRPRDGVFRAGSAGMTVPRCESCPPPEFSAAALWKQKQGTITLSILVSADGHVVQAKVVGSVGDELDAQAIKAVENYRFRPALDPDGRPVTVLMPYGIMFRVAGSK